MKTMKAKLFLIALVAVTLFSCQKEKNEPVNATQDVVFNATIVDPSTGLKSTEDWECKDLDPDYAHVIIDGTDYYPLVFRLDGVLYTQAIKLPVGSYTVSQFLLMDDNGTPNNLADDQIVMGTPEDDSDYSVYVTETVDFDFNVVEFTKIELDVEVLCFQDAEYDAFGFDWFQVTEIVIREQCFFGDLCIKHLEDYEGSLYEEQSTGLQIDMPAIVEIVVKKNGVPVPGSPFSNAYDSLDYGVGQALCVQYPDNLNVDNEVFTFEIKILVRVGSNFSYVSFINLSVTDDELLDAGTDGVVDFVLGNCNLTDPDIQLAPYQNLPTTASINIFAPGNPGYWDLLVNSVAPAGNYDLLVGVDLEAFCGDPNTGIWNGNHNVYVYTSLYNDAWPAGMPFTLATIAKVNWLFNHLSDYSIDILNMTQAQGVTIQQAVWLIINGTPSGDPVANDMASDASTHGDFVPLPGGWAAVLLVKDNLPQDFQLIFTVVDP